MSTVSFHTMVYDSPPTPMGLIGRTFYVMHHCNLCRQKVRTDELVTHARDHREETR
jgi:hypothetical protein